MQIHEMFHTIHSEYDKIQFCTIHKFCRTNKYKRK